MQWTDTAIILSTRRHGESSAIVRALTRSHGVSAGMVRGAFSKTNRGILQPGNVVNLTWQARNADQLGAFRAELLVPNAALLMQDAQKLSALVAACSIIEAALPEHHPYERIYRDMLTLMDALEHAPDWLQHYVRFELALLADSGFGLDLSECAATGTTQDLVYVSPKSGRAVCEAAGRPYHERMLPLPGFLRAESHEKITPTLKETLAGMRLTGYFLDAWLLGPHKKTLPAVRNRLWDGIEKQLANATENEFVN